MLFVLHRVTEPFVFGISNIINNYKYSMDTLMVLIELNFHHLMVVDICVQDHMTKQFIYGILKHQNHYIVWCVDISPLQINDNKMNNIGVIGGNGYTICSGSYDKTIQIWDIETTKQLNVFKGHQNCVRSVKYGSNELINTILSGSNDKSVRLWDIRSGQQIQVFNGHTIKIILVIHVICSGSWDNTIRFWDIRSNKNELYMIKGEEEDNGITSLKFIVLKKKENIKNDLNLCYGSNNGPIRIWG
ncbi:WD repeat-containing protein [Reticulomyxa filosa]|uniref:WD repeat-containing protein n=1 Tax=Reticulomyxa filosa TaxID=46433 RepID=X6MFG8_RETFI|nr:WD repeat-containing protein [Reticulomyxa filosa]|eukprot:ETO11790.1 WD repeat-containing protein [Reticulomyxa filosa]